MLFVLALLSLVAVAILDFSTSFASQYARIARHADLDQAGAIAIDMITHDLRNSGFNLDHGAQAGIATAAPDRIEILSDLNADGDCNDVNERVEYAFRAGRRLLTRRSGRSSPQPMLNDLGEQGLQLTYWDRSGNSISGTALGVEARRGIARVGLDLYLEWPGPDSSNRSQPIRSHHSAVVALRNVIRR